MCPRLVFAVVVILFLVHLFRAQVFYDTSRGDESIKESIIKAMNQSVNPCDDLYQYACGQWIADTPIPPEESRYSRAFGDIAKRNNKVIASILTDPKFKILNQFYKSCLNTDAIEKFGDQLYKQALNDIDEQLSQGDNQTIASITAAMTYSSASMFFDYFVDANPGSPDTNIFQIIQGGIKIPKSIYDAKTEDTQKLLQLYKEHARKMFTMLDIPTTVADQAIQLETQIARLHEPDEDFQDPFDAYNPLSLNDFLDKYPNFAWNQFFKSFPNQQPPRTINVISVKSMNRLNQFLSTLTAEEVSGYAQWTFLNAWAQYMPQRFREEHFNFFGKILRGADSPPPRDVECIDTTTDFLGFTTGQEFVSRVFPQSAKQIAINMINTIHSSFNKTLKTVSWMDDKTRSNALLKLSEIVDRVGYPDVWPSENFTVGDTLYWNIKAGRVFSALEKVNSWNRPVNPNKWEMSPSTINAYYNPAANSMNFPAAILSSPYFDEQFPVEINYGGSGMIMGHEQSHGFDNQGRNYDGKGRLVKNLWTEQSVKAYNQRAQCLVSQYSKYCPYPGHCVNGQLTLGENIADTVGVDASFEALKALIGDEEGNKASIVPFLTRYQLYWIANAQGWCTVARKEEIIRRLEQDVHSPSFARVNGPASDSKFYGDLFNCPRGSIMNPQEKCQVFN